MNIEEALGYDAIPLIYRIIWEKSIISIITPENPQIIVECFLDAIVTEKQQGCSFKKK